MKSSRLVCLILAAINLWFYLRVLRPVRRLAHKAGRLSNGDFTALSRAEGGIPEIDTLRVAMNALVGHVRRTQVQERTYSQALTNGQEAERARLARELHDETTQSLIAIAQSLEIAQSMIDPSSPATALLATAREQAVETVQGLRRLIANLRPPILAELGLIPALQVLAEESHAAVVTVEATGAIRRLDETQELVLFRSAQEALLNARRHGHARHIAIQVTYQSNMTCLSIQDDGIGFDPPGRLDTLSASGHYGLIGIHERIQHLNGTLQIASRLGAGACIKVDIPVLETLQPETVVRDPVCSALIAPQQAYASLEYAGQRYYFCCPVCQGAFQTEPQVYLQVGAGREPVGENENQRTDHRDNRRTA